jgi:WD40 repeat protein
LGKERYRRPALASGACVFTPDGKGLAASGDPRDLTVWNAADGKEVRRLAAGTWITAAAFSPDGKLLAGATPEGAVILWDVDSGKHLPQSSDAVRAVAQLQFTEGGKQLAAAAGDLIAWDPATGREVRRLPGAGLYLPGSVSPGGKLVAVANFDSTIALRDSLTGKTVQTLPGHGFLSPRVSCFTPDERRLITACESEKVILVWDVAGGKVVHRLTGLNGSVTNLAVSPDGRWLASSSFNNQPGQVGDDALRLWDLRTGREAKRLPHDLFVIWDLTFSPDGSRLAAGGMQLHRSPPGRVQVWEVPAGKDLLTFDTDTGSVMHLAFSPDSRTLATGGADARLRVWEVATGGERLRFRGHEGEIQALTFAPDGRSLAAASPDAPVFVWDVADTPRRQKLSAEDLRRCWDDLAGDAAAAFRAIRRLAAAPEQSLSFLRERLGPVPAADPERLRQLFDALDSDEFARRKQAAAELSQLADRASDALRRELEKTSSAEVRRALGGMLDDLGAAPTGEQLRAVRAVEAAEKMGTPEAARWLGELAGGAPGAHLTREAGAARERLRAIRPGGTDARNAR